MKTWILFVPVCVAFSQLANAKLIDGVKAVVQDRPILISDVNERTQAVKESVALASILGVSGNEYSAEDALNSLIEEKIVITAAKDLGAEPTESDVNKQISAIAAQNNLSVDGLKKSLLHEKINFDLYKQNILVSLAKRAVVEREIRSASAGQSDQELKSYYEQNVPDELLISMIQTRATKSGLAKLSGIRASLEKTKKISIAALKKYSAVDLSWNDTDGLSDAFRAALAKRGSSSVTNVFVSQGSAYLLIVREKRKGSTANFEATKEQIRQRLQVKDSEERYKTWIDQKKKTLNIVVNKV